MHQLSSKQKELFKRFLIYSLMTFSVIIIVSILIMVMTGYRFNRADGSLAQGGLIQFASKPNGAEVVVDGTLLGSKTSTKTTTESGVHEVVMRKNGYREWNKTIEVAAGSVNWLNYTRLIPKDIVPVPTRSFATLVDTLASPTGKWYALKSDATVPAVVVVNLQHDEPVYNIIDIPETSYTKPVDSKTQRFDLLKWNQSERYILISHTYDESKQEWLVLDREKPEQTRSITKLLNIQIDQVEFAADDGNTFFIRTGQNVSQTNLDKETVSNPLVTGVSSFSPSIYNQKIISYVTIPNEKTGSRSVGYYKSGDDEPNVIRTYEDATDKNILISIGRYDNATYIAVSNNDTVEILRGDLPTPNSTSSLKVVGRMLLSGNAAELSIEGEGRFVYTRHGAQYATYDLDQKEAYVTTLTTAEASPRIKWLDDYMVWSDFDSKLQFYEFDGSNHQSVNAVVSGYDATLSPNGRFVYSVNKTSTGELVLQQSRLILN